MPRLDTFWPAVERFSAEEGYGRLLLVFGVFLCFPIFLLEMASDHAQ